MYAGTRDAEAKAREMAAILQSVADKYHYEIAYDDYIAVKEGIFSENTSVSARAQEFWRQAFRYLPVEPLAQVLRLVFKKG